MDFCKLYGPKIWIKNAVLNVPRVFQTIEVHFQQFSKIHAEWDLEIRQGIKIYSTIRRQRTY